MAPVVFSNSSSRLLQNKLTNSTSSIKKDISQSSVAFPISSSSLSPSSSISKSSTPTILPNLLHEQFSTIIVAAPTTTYTSYVELNNNAVTSEPTPLSDSTPIGDSYAVEMQAPQPSNSGRDIGIVIGCIIGVLILGLIGWVYKAKQSQRKKQKKKGKGKEVVEETVKVKVKDKKRKHRKHRKHRKVEEGAGVDTGGEPPAAPAAEAV